MPAALPYMPVFVSDYFADTMHLSTLEHGAYLLLLFHYWKRGEALPNDPEQLRRLAGVSRTIWTKISPIIADFFHDDGTHWVHDRVEAELERARAKCLKAQAAGQQSGASRRQRTLNGRSRQVEPPANSPHLHLQLHTPLPPSAPPAEDGGVIFSEPEMREGNGDGFVPSESDRNAIFAAVTRFHTKHADPNSTEAERQAAFATWMGNWVTKTAAGNFERELALSRTAYGIYPALQAAARKQTEVSNEGIENGAGQEGASNQESAATVEEGATDGSHKPRRGRRRRVGIGAIDAE